MQQTKWKEPETATYTLSRMEWYSRSRHSTRSCSPLNHVQRHEEEEDRMCKCENCVFIRSSGSEGKGIVSISQSPLLGRGRQVGKWARGQSFEDCLAERGEDRTIIPSSARHIFLREAGPKDGEKRNKFAMWPTKRKRVMVEDRKVIWIWNLSPLRAEFSCALNHKAYATAELNIWTLASSADHSE